MSVTIRQHAIEFKEGHMAFIEVPNAMLLTLQYIASGKQFVNTFSFHKATPYTEAELSDMVSEVEAAWTEALQTSFASDYALTGAQARALDTEAGAFSDIVFPTPINGGRAVNGLALHTCMTVTYTTGNIGRSRRGRVYHSGLGQIDQASDRTWTTGAATEIGIAYAAFAFAMRTVISGSQHVVISRQSGGVELAEGVTYNVTGYQGRIPIATLRKRL